ncbi:MAG TPA: PilZ domain-containing protein [Thermoanaerobaculia bacterium]|nr:PilZ domain-containing protein [Thermoanaerobaculia bacterium]
MGVWNVLEWKMSKERRRAERYTTASIPVQLSDIDGELIDLSLQGAAVVHRSPIKAGSPVTLIFPSYGGIYVPCQVLRSVVQVRRTPTGSEYVFRSAISFLPMEPAQRGPLHEFLNLQIERLREAQRRAAADEASS